MLIGAVPLLDVEDGRQGPAEGSVRSDLRRRPRRPLVALQNGGLVIPSKTHVARAVTMNGVMIISLGTYKILGV
jgi:hypothetical protein